MPDAHLRVFRGGPDEEARFDEFDVPVEEGMVVLDALHWIQGHEAPDLAVRWNCKAAKCGSCSAEVDGRPRLTCKTRLSDFDLDAADHRRADARLPAHPRPRHRRVLELRGQQDDRSRSRRPTTSRRRTGAGSSRTSSASRSTGSASSASCARTSATCCATTRPRSRSWARATSSASAGLEMHPIDEADRRGYLKDSRRDRLLQHHQVLHRGLPGAHQDHRQRDHPAQGAGRRRVLRPDPVGLAQDPRRRVGRRPSASSCRSSRGRRRRSRQADAAARPSRRRARVDATPTASRTLATPLTPRASRGPAGPAPASGADRPTTGFVIRTDGAARGNPGRPRWARPCIDLARPDARDPSRRPDASISDYLGVQTNNVAEYTGVVRALELARSSARGGPAAARLEAHRRAARRPLAGQGREAASRSGPRRAGRSAGFRPLVRGARAARPELPRGRAGQRGDRPGHGRRPGLGRAPARPAEPVAGDSPERRSGRSAGQRGGRMAARRRRGNPVGREESPSSAAQGSG